MSDHSRRSSSNRELQRQSLTANKILVVLLLSVGLVAHRTVSFHTKTKYGRKQHDPSLDAPLQSSSEKNNVTQANSRKIVNSTRNFTLDNEASCIQWNSQDWLAGPRIGNINDPLFTNDFAMSMILDSPHLLTRDGSVPVILKQSLCHERSRFLNWTDDGGDDRSVHFWSLRLMYLAFHIHQHRPARKETRNRRVIQEKCREELEKHHIGNFDYECPDTKFLAVPMGTSGLGVTMRLGVVNALILGVSTNRTVLFMSNTPTGPRFLRRPWVHASCDRRDLQCFYLPSTPCVVTEKDLAEAYVLQRGEQRQAFRYGAFPPEHNNTRVIAAEFSLRPQRVPENFRPNLLKIASEIIDQLRESNPRDVRIPVLQQAAETILEVEPEDTSSFWYNGIDSRVHHVATFYGMRPNHLASKKLAEIMENVLPHDFNSDSALGLPIRDSDKCLEESECLSFNQYMKLMRQVWMKNHALFDQQKGGPVNIVLTSESESILEARVGYETNDTLKRSIPFAFSFVTNEYDVMQGTGLPADSASHKNVTMDEVMLSAVSSLKAQLMTRFTVGNCCSNFHLMLFDFLRDGCGAARDNTQQCLQANEDPEFRACCQWSKTEECQAKRGIDKAKEKASDK